MTLDTWLCLSSGPGCHRTWPIPPDVGGEGLRVEGRGSGNVESRIGRIFTASRAEGRGWRVEGRSCADVLSFHHSDAVHGIGDDDHVKGKRSMKSRAILRITQNRETPGWIWPPYGQRPLPGSRSRLPLLHPHRPKSFPWRSCPFHCRQRCYPTSQPPVPASCWR